MATNSTKALSSLSNVEAHSCQSDTDYLHTMVLVWKLRIRFAHHNKANDKERQNGGLANRA